MMLNIFILFAAQQRQNKQRVAMTKIFDWRLARNLHTHTNTHARTSPAIAAGSSSDLPFHKVYEWVIIWNMLVPLAR